MTFLSSPGKLRRPLLILAAASVGLLAGAGPVAAAQAVDDASLVRLAHLAPDISGVDVSLTSLSSPEALQIEDLSYGEVSDYQRVAPGFYNATLTPTGESAATPILTASLEVTEGAAATVAVTGIGEGHSATVLTDDLTPPPAGQARIRLLQGASSAPTVDVSAVDGPVLAEDVEFGTATGYANVPAGPWTIRIEPTEGSAEPATTEVTLTPGSVRTLLLLDDGAGVTARQVGDEPGAMTTREVVDGQGMAQMPVGGVQTGAGPTAGLVAGTGPGGLTLPVLALAGIAGLGTAVALLRRPSSAPRASTGRSGGR